MTSRLINQRLFVAQPGPAVLRHLVLLALLLLPSVVFAQTTVDLHDFNPYPNGAYPMAGLVQGSDGNFYGTSEGGSNANGSGGNYGTVFMVTSAGVVTTLHTFIGSDGSNPTAALVQGSDGNFYGTTPSGGASNDGTVFKITPGGVLTTLHSFAGSDGSNPAAGLVQGSDGNFYGTASSGSASGFGTVFKITPTGVMTTLYSFTGSLDGANPTTVLVQGSDGNFYGATSNGGIENGSVFKITPAGVLTPLYPFAGSHAVITGLVQGSDGNFYGTMAAGLNSSNGAIFEMTPAGVGTLLYSFTGGSDGSNPAADLVQDSDGNFHGTTLYGGASGNNDGTVFSMTPSGVLTTLHSFTGADGIIPAAGLIQGSDGNFYGSTAGIGSIQIQGFPQPHNTPSGLNEGNNEGTIFKITPAGVLTSMYSFAGTEGALSEASLAQGSDGNFYGTTVGGGASGNGTVFKITPAGLLSNLYSFSGADGSSPTSGLVQGSDGSFYGTTVAGGASGYGTIYQITPADVLTTLCSFAGLDGTSPIAGLVLGSDGTFYGTTLNGGAGWSNSPSGRSDGYGTVFSITAAGTLTTLQSLPAAASDGVEPDAGLVQGSDGNFYGTTNGTVFKITPAGVLTTLLISSGRDTGLVQGSDGNFYGTNTATGVTFKMTPAGVMTNLTLTGAGSVLVQGSDGNFYGTTYQGGVAFPYLGSVFKMTPAGDLTTLYSFTGAEGAYLFAGLVQDSDGNLYGTTGYGGLYGAGTVFEVVLPPTAPTDLRATAGNTQVSLAWTASPGATSYSVYRGTAASGESATAIRTSTTTAYTDTGLTDGATYYYLVTAVNAGGTSGPSNEASATPTITFTAGLQMFSVPYAYPGINLNALFGYTGVELAAWSPANNQYALTPTAPADQVSLGQGYWARFPQAVALSSIGTPAPTSQNFDITLAAGWNMIGDPFLTSPAITSLLFNNGSETYAQATSGNNPLIGPVIWGYSPVANAYSAATSLDPEQGYWIFAFADTDVQVPHP